MRGSVIDFMNVGVGPLRTGIFNVADMAILLGRRHLRLHAPERAAGSAAGPDRLKVHRLLYIARAQSQPSNPFALIAFTRTAVPAAAPASVAFGCVTRSVCSDGLAAGPHVTR